MPAKRICVLTSGGDAPGMNAAIRAVVRSALDRGWQALGAMNGYAGLIEGTLRPLNDRDVGGIVQRGGTVLGSARCPELETEAGQHAAISSLARAEVDALIVIGGNGSQAGAHALCGRGVDVMGRDCGYLALMAAVAGGAEAVAIPEVPASVGAVADAVRDAYRRGKAHALIVVAEGCTGGSTQLAADLAAHHADVGFDVRVTRIGHVQRGGAPNAFDRILASRTGAAAIEALAHDRSDIVVGIATGEIRETPLAEVVGRIKPIDPAMFELARVLAR
jgi:6-phosphofructokinase 1